jgi:hypothetical protein
LRVVLDCGSELEDRESREGTQSQSQSLVQELEERDVRHPEGGRTRHNKPIVEKKIWATNRFWPYGTPATGNWS